MRENKQEESYNTILEIKQDDCLILNIENLVRFLIEIYLINKH